MSEATPGPWDRAPNETSIFGPPDDARLIASCGALTARSPIERIANAQLISAAPDLLAACEAALEELEVYRCDVCDMEAPENVDGLDRTIEQVKTAIAKAKGGSQ